MDYLFFLKRDDPAFIESNKGFYMPVTGDASLLRTSERRLKANNQLEEKTQDKN